MEAIFSYYLPTTFKFAFFERIFFSFGRETTMNAFKCHATCRLQHNLTILVSDGDRDSFWRCSFIINASVLIRIPTFSLVDWRVEQSVEISFVHLLVKGNSCNHKNAL